MFSSRITQAPDRLTAERGIMKATINSFCLRKDRERGPVPHWILVSLLCGLVFGAPGASFGDIVFEDVNPDQSNHYADDPPGRASGGRVNGLTSVPGTNQVFYAATEWGGLYKTTDSGRRWFRLDDHLPAATWDVEVNPADPNIVYASSSYDGRVKSLAGINVSWDGGVTWEHPPTATPPATFNCEALRREQPSAFGISVDPRDPDNVYIGFICGLAISNDRGRTWRFVDPSPDPTPAELVVDVVVHYDEQGKQVIDLCGNEGHFRSKDGGRTWTPGNGLGTGFCSIAVSPDESYVLLAVVGPTVYQTVDGVNWVQNIDYPETPEEKRNQRIPFVATNQRSNEGEQDVFDLWFGNVRHYRFHCTTPAMREPGGSPRCPAGPTAGPFQGAHVDVGDIAFDPLVDKDACPLIFSSDGGVYRNTLTSSPDCHNPRWTQPDVTPHALWLWSLDGAHQEGPVDEDLYFGTQDNGIFGTTEGGAFPKPAWNNGSCCDVFDIAATSQGHLAQSCCGLSLGVGDRGAQSLVLFIHLNVNPDPDPSIRVVPTGGLIGFRFPETIDQWGGNRFVLVTGNIVQNGTLFDGGLFITTDGGVKWTELGHGTEPPTSGLLMCAVRAALDPVTQVPTFYAQVGTCETRDADQLWRFVGTDPNGRWEQIRLPRQAKGAGISIFAVDRSNPKRLYASLIAPGKNPRMIFSENGGTTWRRDRELDRLMRGHGAFRYQSPPIPSLGVPGRPQPTLLAFDPQDRNLIVAGGHDSGVFLSGDSGKHWRLVTDPFDPVGSDLPHLTQPRFAYFDHDPHNAVDVYIGTRGRGVWRMRVSRSDDGSF